MLNRDGISKTTMTAPKQILANVELQSSVGCIVPKELGVAVGNKTIAKAGTPISINLTNLQQVVKKPTAAAEGVSAVPMNAVLLHDVDVSNGNANGTALVFGFINIARLDSDVVSAVTTAQGISGASPLLTFVKM